jgi:hypothetical protein
VSGSLASFLRPFIRLLSASVVLTAPAACASGPDLDTELATVRSWTATARLAIAERRAGATTATYTRQLGDRAQSVLAEARRTLGPIARTAADRQHAAWALDSLARALRALDEAARP